MRTDLRLLAALFVTGLAALAFEVLWSRALIPWIGGTALAQVTTVGMYMLGLFIGAMIGERRAERVCDPRRTFVRLEALAALLSALAILGLPLADPLLGLFSRGELLVSGTGALLRGLVGGIWMLPATILMGWAFPLAIHSLQQSGTRGSSAALTYGVNTLGATAGTLLGGFLLVPLLGIRWGVLIVAALDLVVLFLVSRSAAPAPPVPPRRSQPTREVASSASTATTTGGLSTILFSVLIGGMVSLGLEILLFRVLGLLLGPTARAFTVVLGCYVFGLGVGSLLVQPLLRNERTARGIFLFCWIFVGVFGLALNHAFAVAAESMVMKDIADGGPLAHQLMKRSWLAFALLFPLTTAFGASYPSAVAVHGQARASRAARVYAFLTLGNIGGLALVAFLGLPRLGMQGSVRALASLAFLAPVPFLVARARAQRIHAIAAAVLIVLAIVPAFASRPWNLKALNSAPYLYPRNPEFDWQKLFLYFKTDFETTVAVVKDGDHRVFTLDGKADGSTTRADMSTQAILGILPGALHPSPKLALVVGLGTGQTVAELLRLPVERVDCAELSHAVVESLPYFCAINGDLKEGPRFRVLPTDGRTVLRYGSTRYDLIVSEPSNVWVPGVAHLFTRETFLEARARLDPDGGLFLQWLHTYMLDEATIKTIVRTMLDVFPHVTLWNSGLTNREALFIASHQPLRVSFADLERRLAAAGFVNQGAPGRPVTAYTLLGDYVAGPDRLRAFAGDGPLSSDARPKLEYAAERALLGNDKGPYHRLLAELIEAPDAILVDADAALLERLHRQAVHARGIQRILSGVSHSNDDYLRLAKEASDDPEACFALAEVLAQYSRGIELEQPDDARVLLDTALTIWPGYDDALRQRIRLDQRRGDATGAMRLLDQYEQSLAAQCASGQVMRAEVYLQTRAFDRALMSYEAALEKDPQSILALIGIAELHATRGDRVRSEEALRRLLNIDPGNQRALAMLRQLEQ